MPDGCRGFTLIELLVVVAIISILASIAVPNFLEAQTRAKVSRVKADMRSLATALEAYAVDNNNYPARKSKPGTLIQPPWPDLNTRIQDLSRLTTPVSYISTIPIDVFENHIAPPSNVFDYWSREAFRERSEVSGQVRIPFYRGWMLTSVGPDGVTGQRPAATGNLPASHATLIPLDNWKAEYDATNGTISYGNVSRTQNSQILDQIFR